MPRKAKQPKITCQFFVWRLMLRDGVYYADGRGNKLNVGKHSLNTRDKNQALEYLNALDLHMAVKAGLVDETAVIHSEDISIKAGWRLYYDHCSRGQVLGGVSANTLKRYRAVRTKHEKFCARVGIETWSAFGKSALEAYGNSLDEKYADRTIFLELTLLKSVVSWLTDNGHLPPGSELKYPLRKPQGTDTYCYTPAEVLAMAEHCKRTPGLVWLGNVILALAHTGTRISELAGLRWNDINLAQGVLVVADERSSHRKRQLGTVRTAKGRRSRSIPIHPELHQLLASLEHKPDGYVFHAAQGGRLRSRNVLQMFINDVIEPLKERFQAPSGDIGFEHGRLHSFRHFFCSQAFIGGASEGEIKEWLGHADSKMVEHYRHLRGEDAKRKMANIDFLVRSPDRPNDAA
jgi:integrase